ncbi:peptidoglycan DD-metalloendopeptidase family protein [Mucilaginibacter sp. CSA2-8R]|uniref:peptidoglycan DD-metalloendopeptidase family protein n=1 Tax=Mucilaginibacter sp. CSA2-8R TaxID=3141542 RepID=UPI00315D7C16
MDRHGQLASFIQNHPNQIGKVVDIDLASDRLLALDFTENNLQLTADEVADTPRFSAWVNRKLAESGCRYGIGGYFEHRTLYARSSLFNTTDTEPRRLHLGTDIWGPAHTPVYAPLAGKVHSFQDNDNFGDYGPTIILKHDLNGLALYTLYGHLNRAALQDLAVGKPIGLNQQIACFGHEDENGHWPPHLHFQLMFDMQGLAGDYPGVCRYSEKDSYQKNIPDPDLILQFSKATIM